MKQMKRYETILFMLAGLGASLHIVSAQQLTKRSEQILNFVIDQCRLDGFVTQEASAVTRMYKITEGAIARDEKGNPITERIEFRKMVAKKTISDKSGIKALITVRIDGVRQEETKKFQGTSSIVVTIADGAKVDAQSVRFMREGRLVASLPDGRQYSVTCSSVHKAAGAK